MSDLFIQSALPLAWAAFILAAIPAVLTVLNHLSFRSPPAASEDEPQISILIPARNEEANIETAVQAALRSERAIVEVVVLDDHSTDRTAEIVTALSQADPRVRLERAPELPEGWCGKQHACARLAEKARYDLMLFVDADVTMSPEAPARLAAFMKKRKAALVSAFPHQVTATFWEKLLIPLIEYILLGYLPIQMGRWTKLAGFGAGCGQVFLAEKAAYQKAGGHTAIKQSMHDGVKLPRAFRKAGFHTDLCAGHKIFSCRMYHNEKEVFEGLGKNAHEGIASPAMIMPFTIMLLGGSLLPLILFFNSSLFLSAFWAQGMRTSPMWLINVAAWLSLLPRFLNTIRFNQSFIGLLLHPLSVLAFLWIQWRAFILRLAGRKPSWKGRAVG